MALYGQKDFVKSITPFMKENIMPEQLVQKLDELKISDDMTWKAFQQEVYETTKNFCNIVPNADLSAEEMVVLSGDAASAEKETIKTHLQELKNLGFEYGLREYALKEQEKYLSGIFYSVVSSNISDKATKAWNELKYICADVYLHRDLSRLALMWIIVKYGSRCAGGCRGTFENRFSNKGSDYNFDSVARKTALEILLALLVPVNDARTLLRTYYAKEGGDFDPRNLMESIYLIALSKRLRNAKTGRELSTKKLIDYAQEKFAQKFYNLDEEQAKCAVKRLSNENMLDITCIRKNAMMIANPDAQERIAHFYEKSFNPFEALADIMLYENTEIQLTKIQNAKLLHAIPVFVKGLQAARKTASEKIDFSKDLTAFLEACLQQIKKTEDTDWLEFFSSVAEFQKLAEYKIIEKRIDRTLFDELDYHCHFECLDIELTKRILYATDLRPIVSKAKNTEIYDQRGNRLLDEAEQESMFHFLHLLSTYAWIYQRAKLTLDEWNAVINQIIRARPLLMNMKTAVDAIGDGRKYGDTDTVQILEDLVKQIDDGASPERIVDEMLNNVHYYDAYEGIHISKSRTAAFQEAKKKISCKALLLDKPSVIQFYGDYLGIDIKNMLSDERVVQLETEETTVLRSELLLMYFLKVAQESYPIQREPVGKIRQRNFKHMVNQLNTVCYGEFNDALTLDYFLCECLGKNDPITFYQEIVQSGDVK